MHVASGRSDTDRRRRKVRKAEALLTTGALQSAIFNSANFSSIATDAAGVIQIFNVGAERMLGYAAADVVNKITPADISDPQEVISRARALSAELGTAITIAVSPDVVTQDGASQSLIQITARDNNGQPLRNLSLRDHENGLSTGEKQMFVKAKKILVSELMYAKGMDEEEAAEWLDDILAGAGPKKTRAKVAAKA